MKTTINIDDELLKAVKIKAIDNEMTMTDLITLYLKFGLTNHINKKSVEFRYKKLIKKS